MIARIRRHHQRPRRRGIRVLLAVAGSLVGLALLLGLIATLAVRGSLARLTGERPLAGLDAVVTVTRDALGVPDITAASRRDAARALGYLHAQDRFFQMDLQRRNAAGELAALLGPLALEMDRDTRRHRFRVRAAQVVAQTRDHERAILAAYTEGVNAGLRDLRVRPWEYLVLRQQPQPWRPEDTVLTLYTMFLDLSLATASSELAWAAVRDNLPAALAAFLLPLATRWDAPLQDDPLPLAGVPDSTLVDVRTWDFDGKSWQSFLEPDAADSTGSNNWAVAGSRTGHGGALLANDMHLGHGLPNIWYRARSSWPADGGRRAVVGVTLPGTPAFVAGSNADVAWGFTNSEGDWVDLVILETDTTDVARYLTPDGWREFVETTEIIAIEGGRPDTLVVSETIWGPVWTQDTQGRPVALRWTAHDTEAVNLSLLRFESAGDVAEIVALAGSVGIPPQNLVCADRTGRIAWTIAGRIPRRVGWDGRLPASWADGRHRWDGYLEPAEQPRLLDPVEGLLWTANNRIVGGADLVLVGDGGYALGARASQIRDGLRALPAPVESDMLALQLDDRALMLDQWREKLLAVLDREAEARPLDDARGEFARIVRDEWEGRAVPTSVSYRLVRNTVFAIIDRVYELLTKPCRDADADFAPRWLPYRHAVAWELLSERPAHLLPAGAADWDAVVLDAVDQVGEYATRDGRDLRDYTWGAQNVVRVAHPFARLAPRLARWLAAPPEALPGDASLPRVQGRTSGASQRLVVSPGREQDGIFHMPGGQSGHPLSPFFLAGHDDWAAGRASPLLPGPARHLLRLVPR